MGGQALDASRTPAFTFKPQDLILVTDPKERFYSPTVNDPVSDLDVLDCATRGILVSIRVRRTDRGSIVTAGRQRTKRALIVNALTGVAPYTGDLSSVVDAIERLKDSSIGQRVVELAIKNFEQGGVMLFARAANSGTETEEEANGLVEDEMRRGGSGYPWDVRARRAVQLIERGQPIEVVAAGMQDVTVETLKRWIAKLNAGETSAPKPKKERAPRATSTRPKFKIVKKLYARAAEVGGLSPREFAILDFVMGKMNEHTLSVIVPELAPPAEEATTNV